MKINSWFMTTIIRKKCVKNNKLVMAESKEEMPIIGLKDRSTEVSCPRTHPDREL